MHAHSGELTLKGVKQGDFGKFEVQGFTYSISHPTDAVTGLSSGKVRGNMLELMIDIDPSCMMIIQAVNTNEEISGTIKLFKPDAAGRQATFLKVEIKKASCFSYEQVFAASDTEAMRVKLKLSASELDFESGGKMAQYQNEYVLNV